MRFVTFTFNPTTMINAPWLTSSEALAYTYDTREQAELTIAELKARDFGHVLEVESLPTGKFRIRRKGDRDE